MEDIAPLVDNNGHPPCRVEIGSPVATLRHFATLDGPAIGMVVDYEVGFDSGQVLVRWDHTDTESWWPSDALRHLSLEHDPIHRSLR